MMKEMEEYFMELGKNLEEERESYHFTQKEVADMIGISQSYISRLEKRIIKRLRQDLERRF